MPYDTSCKGYCPICKKDQTTRIPFHIRDNHGPEDVFGE